MIILTIYLENYHMPGHLAVDVPVITDTVQCPETTYKAIIREMMERGYYYEQKEGVLIYYPPHKIGKVQILKID